jgi:hypothetical protein
MLCRRREALAITAAPYQLATATSRLSILHLATSNSLFIGTLNHWDVMRQADHIGGPMWTSVVHRHITTAEFSQPPLLLSNSFHLKPIIDPGAENALL